MRALILAAGRGSRMQELTESKPKCLVELHAQPLLLYQIKALRAAGFDEIGIVVGYMKERLETYAHKYGLYMCVNDKWADSNMIYSLQCAKEWLLEDSEGCIISYSDIFYESKAVRDLAQITFDMGIAYDMHWRKLWEARFDDPLSDAESFVVEDGILRDIGSRVQNLDSIQGQYMGLLRFTQVGLGRFFEYAKAFGQNIDSTSLLCYAVQQGEQIACVPYNGIWGECDSKSDIALYERLYPHFLVT